MKIIALPFAGGNKYSFNLLTKELIKNSISLDVIEYPGRGQRFQEKFLESTLEIVDDVINKLIEKKIDSEYIIYGHSMGALIGYLVCQKLEGLKIHKPMKLIVSGRVAPSILKDRKTNQLPSKEFWEEINKLGGMPNDILKEKELKDFFEPILGSSTKLVEF